MRVVSRATCLQCGVVPALTHMTLVSTLVQWATVRVPFRSSRCLAFLRAGSLNPTYVGVPPAVLVLKYFKPWCSCSCFEPKLRLVHLLRSMLPGLLCCQLKFHHEMSNPDAFTHCPHQVPWAARRDSPTTAVAQTACYRSGAC